MGAFARWRSLDAAERLATLHCTIALAAAIAVLRAAGVKRALAVSRRPIRGSSPRDREVRVYAAAVARAGRYLPGGSCLPRSLALAWLLRGRGIEAEVRIGVRREEGLEAHAWVERDGLAVTEPARVADRFVIAW